MNIFSMAHKALRNDIGIAIDKAIRENGKVAVKGVTFNEDTHRHMLNIIAKPIAHPDSIKEMFLVVFEDVESPKTAKVHRNQRRASC